MAGKGCTKNFLKRGRNAQERFVLSRSGSKLKKKAAEGLVSGPYAPRKGFKTMKADHMRPQRARGGWKTASAQELAFYSIAKEAMVRKLAKEDKLHTRYGLIPREGRKRVFKGMARGGKVGAGVGAVTEGGLAYVARDKPGVIRQTAEKLMPHLRRKRRISNVKKVGKAAGKGAVKWGLTGTQIGGITSRHSYDMDRAARLLRKARRR